MNTHVLVVVIILTFFKSCYELIIIISFRMQFKCVVRRTVHNDNDNDNNHKRK